VWIDGTSWLVWIIWLKWWDKSWKHWTFFFGWHHTHIWHHHGARSIEPLTWFSAEHSTVLWL
ncbi:hypothetical protein, partial [Salmonella sp. s54836]|uniref:hypothetical protein n=1 Tax=Salmonella sp. s54836 TaxID=3159673 RepID=UPI003980C849